MFLRKLLSVPQKIIFPCFSKPAECLEEISAAFCSSDSKNLLCASLPASKHRRWITTTFVRRTSETFKGLGLSQQTAFCPPNEILAGWYDLKNSNVLCLFTHSDPTDPWHQAPQFAHLFLYIYPFVSLHSIYLPLAHKTPCAI